MTVLSGWPSIADYSIMSDTPNYRGYRFPSEIIAQAVWLYHRFKLSFRDVEDLLAERGVTVSYETIRQWRRTFGPQYARRIKRRLGPRGDRWFLDEVVVSIQGKRRSAIEPMARLPLLKQRLRDAHHWRRSS